MTAVACQVLLVVWGVVSGAAFVQRDDVETPLEWKPCVIDGTIYQDGQLTDDPCGRCRCANGVVACLKISCHIDARQGREGMCYYRDKWYESGKKIDKEGLCFCMNGMVACY